MVQHKLTLAIYNGSLNSLSIQFPTDYRTSGCPFADGQCWLVVWAQQG